MKRYVVLIVIVSAVLITVFSSGVLTDNAFGQDEETPARRMQRERREQAENMRERFKNMSPEEREKFKAEMEERREKFQNMSDEERKKLRAEMSERLGSRPEGVGRDAQLQSIKAIEVQVAKLKAAVEVVAPEDRSRLRELSQEDRAKLREKMMAAMGERQTAIRAIEQELAKLKGSRRPATESEARLSELREIHKLALKEKATQTADRLDKLIVSYQRGSVGRDRPPVR
ncbi:MAG: hypothetical protein WBC05_12765, partial [Sedimentisphaerales bacterium]